MMKDKLELEANAKYIYSTVSEMLQPSTENNTKANVTGKILNPGKNCWTCQKSHRVAFLIDAADYYQAFRVAVLNAKKTIYITAWDIKTYTLIRDLDAPNRAVRLIDLLKYALQRNRELNVYILCWNWTLLFAHDREWFARLKWKLKGHPRLHFRLDSCHPLGGSHHQKIVVVDDAVAFCGGMDLTDERWDTRDHARFSPFRRDYKGRHYRPHHDVQLAVDGDIARSLGELFRSLWSETGGGELSPAQVNSDPWPRYLQPDIRNVNVAVARTIPRKVYEVVEMIADGIKAAKDYIYIENQYFSWIGMIELLEEKLQDPNGPEVILVLPKSYTGIMEKLAIGKQTAMVVERLRRVDRYNRFAVFYPKIPQAGEHVTVKVHSKVLIVDGKFLKVGSANFSNRSMSVDTECDLVIEADGDERVTDAIEKFLFQLIAEHHGCCELELRQLVQARKSVLSAIHGLNRKRPRKLKPLHFQEESLKKAHPLILLAVDPPVSWCQMLAKRQLALNMSAYWLSP